MKHLASVFALKAEVSCGGVVDRTWISAPDKIVPSEAQLELQNEEGKVLFEPGMMFTYEMAVELPDSPLMPFFNVEDNVVVTETSVENMNAILYRDLRVKL